LRRAGKARSIARMRMGSRPVIVACCLAIAAALIASPAAHAGPDTPAAAAAAMRKLEDAGRAKAADEIARLARYCGLVNAYDDARRDYARALAFVAVDKTINADLAKIRGRTAKPAKTVLAGIVERRTKALAKCAEYLAPAAAAYAKADRSDELATLLQLLRAQGVPIDDLVRKLDVVMYEPYLDWRSKAAVAKLDQGWEYVDGAWCDPEKVAAMDAAHATWATHWVFADEVHEIRTTMPRRTAKQVLAHVGAYRRFVLDYFTGEWDLQTPGVKLPVILTRTRAELEARVSEIPGAPPAPPRAAAFYLSGPDKGNPFFVSFEANTDGGAAATLDFRGLQATFEHELGHQIAYEYSKHAAGDIDDGDFLWVIEGVAEFLPNYDLVDGVWTLKHPRSIPCGGGELESAFGWAHTHADELPPLASFLALKHDEFLTARNYHVAAALACYLLEGKDREYRPRFIQLAEAVHRTRATRVDFATCFQGIDLAALGEEFKEFCRGLVLDE
jgi:hypothetical protein